MLIRRLQRDDLRELLALYRYLHAADEPLPEPAIVDSVWTELLANSNCYKVMLLTGRKDESTFRFYESAGFDRNAKQAFVATPDA